MPVCPDGHDSSSGDYCSFCGITMPPTSAPEGAAPLSGLSPMPYSSENSGDSTQIAEVCAVCASPLPGGARYCEECGWDQHQPRPAATPVAPPMPPAPPGAPLSAPPGAPVGEAVGVQGPQSGSGGQQPLPDGDFPLSPPSQAHGTWMAVVTADRDYFQDMMTRSGPDAQGLFFPPYCPERRIPLRGPQMRIGRRSAKTGSIPEIDLATSPEDPGVSHNHAVLREEPDGTWVVVDLNAVNGTTINGSPDPIAVNLPITLKDGDRVHVGAWTTITLRRL